MVSTQMTDIDRQAEAIEAHFASGDVERAKLELESALTRHGGHPRLLGDLGVILALQGRSRRARVALARARELAPTDDVIAANLADLDEQEASQCHGWRDLSPREAATPSVSIIVPTYGSAANARRLLGCLGRQSVNGASIEVLMVDDGSPDPISAALTDLAALPYHAAIARTSNGGPGRARNLALKRARARWILILNDDAVPEPDLIERHLLAHREARKSVAVLGAFPYSERARRSVFVQLLERLGLTFGYHRLEAGCDHDFWSFWTCNISLLREHLEAVGGFDERFDEPMMEDIECGWRLWRQLGLKVRYEPRAICHHDHLITVAGYERRQRMLGRACHRLWQKTGNCTVLELGLHLRLPGHAYLGPIDDVYFEHLERAADDLAPKARAAVRALTLWDRRFAGRSLDEALADVSGVDIEQLADWTRTLDFDCAARGQIEAAQRTRWFNEPSLLALGR